MEKVVPLCTDLLCGENVGPRYLPEEALELTELVRLLTDNGLLASARCWRAVSIAFISIVVCMMDAMLPGSLISAGACRVGGDMGLDLQSPGGIKTASMGRCCTLATMAGFSTSYCCTV